MKNSDELKRIVRDKYSEIARQEKDVNQASCCGSGNTSQEVYNIMSDDYAQMQGYAAQADLGLGCGLPTQFALIQKGDTVIDLGSGAGNDCFVARHQTGNTGKVVGIDFSEAMIAKARTNAEKLGYHNVEFRQGDIEALPVSDNAADVIVSNCVLNLLPDKRKAIGEIFRTLRPGGHFSISDIVLEGELPHWLRHDAAMYAGCVSGAIQKEEYLRYISEIGFENTRIQKEKPVILPDDILDQYLNESELENFKKGETGIFSISVFAQKPGGEWGTPAAKPTGTQDSHRCTPSSGCCQVHDP